MKRTAIVYSPRYLDHDTGSGHPESPRRLEAIIEGIGNSGLLERKAFSLVRPTNASLKDLELVHTPKYIRFIKQLSQSGGGLLDENTVASTKSYEVAKLAAGGAISAAKTVMRGEFKNAFVLVRPPGHHASPSRGLGFCIFSNIALAAAVLLRDFGLKRVLVLDVDSHHGNGTQDVFYGEDRVLFISLHEDPSIFPMSGFMEETGRGKGLGYTVNVPLPFGTGDPPYWQAFKTIAVPIAKQYRPQFILVSAGFDGYYRDSVGELSLSAHTYPRIFRTILDLAHQMCEDRMVAVLEGGYRLRFLRKTVPAVIGQMAGLNVRIKDKRPLIDPATQEEAERVIEKVRRIHSDFWSL